jgi:hypothetical protein
MAHLVLRIASIKLNFPPSPLHFPQPIRFEQFFPLTPFSARYRKTTAPA